MPERFVGLMSGTSVDAVDAVLVELDPLRTLATASVPIPAALRAELLALLASGPDELARAARASVALTELYAQASAAVLERAGLRPGSVAALGAHGQTVRHQPADGYTIQLIDGARLAERTRCTTVVDFRSADIAAGGQGAPLVPAFHARAFGHPERRRAIVNLGGIANVSLLAPGEPVRGHDTGPGNALLDVWIERHRGQRYDDGGQWAASGRSDATLLAALLADPYFAAPAPKSTGRETFDGSWLDRVLAATPGTRSPADVQATLVELTARTVGDACRAFGADEVYACGGGTRNAALMAALGTRCGAARLASTDALGLDPQAVEATAFAWLAMRRLRGQPGNEPAVTGARGPRVLGAVHAAPAAG